MDFKSLDLVILIPQLLAPFECQLPPLLLLLALILRRLVFVVVFQLYYGGFSDGQVFYLREEYRFEAADNVECVNDLYRFSSYYVSAATSMEYFPIELL